jgi:alcohol dehydrogenase, propanol-preferring
MKAARIHAYGKPLEIDDVPTPTPGPGQVLVKVAAAGFCHSDLHILGGEIPVLPRMPLTLGHENAGYIARLGPGVTGFREGDAVAVFGGWGCGACNTCITGDEQLCAAPRWVGLSEVEGGYAEYLLVDHARYLVPLKKLDPKTAAPLTDAALTPYRAVRRAMPFLHPDEPVLVIGAGGLGQYGIKLLRTLSGCRVVVVDTDPAKRALALSVGADDALDGASPALGADLAALSGSGFCAAFDFVGTDGTLASALGATRAGGKVTQIGLAGGTAAMKVLATTKFEVTFEATLWGNVRELREVVAMAENGLLVPIESEYASLDQINTVAERLRRGDVKGRLVITP